MALEPEGEQADAGDCSCTLSVRLERCPQNVMLGATEIGIDCCAAASVMLEREPSSLPEIPRRLDGRKNTFYTASKQIVQDSGFEVISGKMSGCASGLNTRFSCCSSSLSRIEVVATGEHIKMQ